jgi:hypothetical protein
LKPMIADSSRDAIDRHLVMRSAIWFASSRMAVLSDW